MGKRTLHPAHFLVFGAIFVFAFMSIVAIVSKNVGMFGVGVCLQLVFLACMIFTGVPESWK